MNDNHVVADIAVQQHHYWIVRFSRYNPDRVGWKREFDISKSK